MVKTSKVKVRLTSNLQKYYPHAQFEIDANSVIELLQKMDEVRPQFSTYILEDSKNVRKHVNIFVDGILLPKNQIAMELRPSQIVHIMQALSGG